MALDASSFGLLNNILSTTGADITSQMAGPVPGVSDIQRTTSAAMMAPNFAMPGGGGFYNSPGGMDTRQALAQGRFAPISNATIANAIRMLQLSKMLGDVGAGQAQSYGLQQRFLSGESDIAAQEAQRLAEISQQGSMNLGLGGFGSVLGGLGNILQGI